MKKFKSACILCSRNCGIVLFTKDKEIIQVQGDRDHPFSKGYICQKAMRLNFYQNHEDRLLHPLKRNENGTFDQITWDQAFLEIATQLRQIQKKNGGTAIAT
jgi:anaerobic selenocysteine-containing dehydrogenase